MCHKHAHLALDIQGVAVAQGVSVLIGQVLYPISIETPTGTHSILPQSADLYLVSVVPGTSPVLVQQVMEALSTLLHSWEDTDMTTTSMTPTTLRIC